MSSLDYLDLCRLCLVKDRVSVPIFDGEGDVRQIFLKIAACLPVKVAREDKLPKKICDDCVYKVELFYQFWNTTANAEKQLLQWLGEVNLEDKQGYVTDVLNTDTMKDEQSTENRLDGNVIQHVGEHQNNMGMGMMDNMGLGIPIIISSANQQQITSVPMDTSGSSVQTVQAVPGPSSQTTHNQISQNRTSSTHQEDEEDTEDEENSDEECDGDDGLTVKEESEEEPSNRTVEPTTFVNVPLACDEAGPSGLQQQKISDIPELPMPQSADEDPKSDSPTRDPLNCVDMNPLEAKIVDDLTKNDRRQRKNRIITILNTFSLVSSKSLKTKRLMDVKKPMRSKKQSLEIKKRTAESAKPIPATNKQSAKRSQPVTMKNKAMEKNRTVTIKKEEPADEAQQFEKKKTEMNSEKKKKKKTEINSDRKSAVRKSEIKRCSESEESAERKETLLLECDHCGKKFERKRKLASHMKMHKHCCPHCVATFRIKREMKEHAEMVHGPVLYPCEFCEYKSTNRWTLRDHFIRRHTTKFNHTCSVCGKLFKIKNDMVQHAKQMHNTAPPILCTVCGNACKSMPALKAHMKYKHNKPAFKCNLCKRCMTTQYNLDQHMLWHNKKEKVVCPICGKIFGQKRDLDIHLKLHDGIKPFDCPVCCKKFARKTAQEQHILIHTGLRPYTCDICGQKFAQKPGLICHRKRHPGPLPPLPITSVRKIILDFTQKLQEKEENNH